MGLITKFSLPSHVGSHATGLNTIWVTISLVSGHAFATTHTSRDVSCMHACARVCVCVRERVHASTRIHMYRVWVERSMLRE